MVGRQSKQRRGKGEGTIRERSDGRWEARYTLPDGKRRSIFTRTQADAQRKLRQALHDLDRGVVQVDMRSTVETQLRAWYHGVAPTLDNATAAAYTQVIETHLAPAIGHIRLVALKPSHLEALYREKLADGYAPNTIGRMHIVLGMALKSAVRDEIIQRNVAQFVRAPKGTRTPMQVFSPEQAEAFLRAAEGHPMEVFFLTAILTGMRLGELTGLHWRDVDLDNGVLSVRWTIRRNATTYANRTEGESLLVLKKPKTKSSARQVRIAPRLVDALRAHRLEQRASRLRMGEAWLDHDLVFCGPLGDPYSPKAVEYAFGKLLASVEGLPRLRFHDLRHTAATLLLRAKINPKVVSELLGHSSVAITLDKYSHVLPDMQEDAALALERAISPSLTAARYNERSSKASSSGSE